MKIYVLVDNTASGNFQAEHGLSYLIDHDEKILFDTGHSDLFIKNAEKLKVDLNKVEKIVLSHGHWDHGNGLKFLQNKTLICHPNVFIKRYRKADQSFIGIDSSFEELSEKYKIQTTKQPYKVSEKIIFLGEIPRLCNYEQINSSFTDQDGQTDQLLDDTGLAIIVENEIVIVSGCAHAGICNIVEHAKTVTGVHRVKAVIGGFHLKKNNSQTKETISYFKRNNIRNIYPSHCTELLALCAFQKEFNFIQVKAGMILKL
jgi:7,8-dihydropterin-6-yl-methyl-4-(beta-D-ribofuranosyl)aminobenzene 5'-phosphate synthase